MKRPMPWSDEEDNDELSSSHSDSDADDAAGKKFSKEKGSEVKSGKRKITAVDFDTLKRHGYRGGPSVLRVPPPKEIEKQDWSWSNGKETRDREIEESYEERQKTRAALKSGEQQLTVQTQKEKKKERDFGQGGRGKNYVENEKRILRESGIYSGFDT